MYSKSKTRDYSKHFIQPFVMDFVEFSQIRFFLNIFSVLECNLFLPGDTFVHFLHMIILILHEWRDGQVELFNFTALVLIIHNFSLVIVIKVLSLRLVQLEAFLIRVLNLLVVRIHKRFELKIFIVAQGSVCFPLFFSFDIH